VFEEVEGVERWKLWLSLRGVVEDHGSLSLKMFGAQCQVAKTFLSPRCNREEAGTADIGAPAIEVGL
jgi:hypothetical protein